MKLIITYLLLFVTVSISAQNVQVLTPDAKIRVVPGASDSTKNNTDNIAANTASILNKWDLSGTSAAYGSKIGTTNNRTFRIITNNSEKGSYDSLGNVIQGSGTWQIGQQLLNPSNQRSTQYASDGSYPAQVSIINTDSVGCVTCTSDSTKAKGLEIAAYEATTGGAFIHFKKARGNYLNPAQIQSGDVTGGIGSWGYTNAGNFSGSVGAIHFVATEAYTATAGGTKITLFSTKNGSLVRKETTIENYGGLTIAPGQLPDQSNALLITATLPASGASSFNTIANVQATTVSNGQSQYGINADMLAGATEAKIYSALRGGNATAGTGASFFNISGNYGVLGASTATTAGYNTALYGFASGGNISAGVFGRAITAKNSATNIGGAFIGRNTGTTPIQIGVYAGLNSTTDPTFVSAALLVDNHDQTSPIALFRDNSTTTFTIADGGAVTSTSTITATQFKLSALNTAPANAGDTGTTGEIRIVNGFIYICVATNTWQRAAIATW